LQRYKRPLFLGGSDTTDNLEISDLEVYWLLMGQLIRQAKGLPAGTPVRLRSLLVGLERRSKRHSQSTHPSSDHRL